MSSPKGDHIIQGICNVQIQSKSKDSMSWFSDLANKAEYILNDLASDGKTGNILKSHSRQNDLANKADYILNDIATTNARGGNIIRNYPHPRPNVLYAQTQNWLQRPLQQNVNQADKTAKTKTKRGLKKDDMAERTSISFRRKSSPHSNKDGDGVKRPTKLEGMTEENALLRTEIIMANRQIEKLLENINMCKTNIDQIKTRNEQLERLYAETRKEKETLSAELNRRCPVTEPEYGAEFPDLASAFRALQKEFAESNEKNAHLQAQLKEKEMSTNSSNQLRLENELRLAQTTMSELRAERERLTDECERIQSDWNAYKLRVKNMLITKDKEIEALQMDPTQTEGTKMLVKQVEALREERDQISSALAQAQDACVRAGQRVDKAEARTHAAENLVCALREALREERKARGKADTLYTNTNKAFKNLQMETSEQLENMKQALAEKEAELQKLRTNVNRSATSVCPAIDNSALNVADSDKRYESMSNEKIQLLTQSIFAKQGRIDALISENQKLKNNIETLEASYRKEFERLKSNQNIIEVTDGDAILKTRVGGCDYTAKSALSRVSLRVGVTLRRHPVFRMLIMLYMALLHVWVLIVLINSART